MKELIYHRLFLPTVDQYADKPAFFDGDYVGTYAEHADRTFWLCHALHHQLGVGPSLSIE